MGHILVGTGAVYGITSLFVALEQPAVPNLSLLNNFDYLFSVFFGGGIVSVVLWKGLIASDESKT
ncbi:MAG: hypothetical protein COA43_08920 [Robiginitomaculum sp.]|nr:MAG: hypothetical protein COA43_08920 [Robiginitomaculum sp.]